MITKAQQGGPSGRRPVLSSGHRASDRSGQELTEYIIIVALIAIGTLLVVGLFGQQVKGVFTGISGGLAGIGNAQNDAGFQEVRQQVKRSGMDTYDESPGAGPAEGNSGGGGCSRRR